MAECHSDFLGSCPMRFLCQGTGTCWSLNHVVTGPEGVLWACVLVACMAGGYEVIVWWRASGERAPEESWRGALAIREPVMLQGLLA